MSLFERLDATADFAVLVALMLATVAATLAWMAREARRECARQQRRAEEAEMWLLLADEEIAAVRRRLAEVERRHDNLQALYAAVVRRRLADGWRLIANNLERHRRR